MIPDKLIEFIDSLNDLSAAKKLIKHFDAMDQEYDNNIPYLTKIGYYVDSETKIARLIFTDLVGKESFDVMSGNIEEFVSKAHTLESGKAVQVYGVALKDCLEPKSSDLLIKYHEYCQKKISKDLAKKMIDKKYSIGDELMLKNKIRNGSQKTVKKFIVRKVIWSVNANPVNILILKQTEGPMNNLSMTKEDCKKYHIKYEDNLQVYSMFMNFVKIN